MLESRSVDQGKKDTRTHLEEEITARAKPLFVVHKKALYQYWAGLDTDRDGHISIKEWRDGCAAICDDKLPWKKLQQTLDLKPKERKEGEAPRKKGEPQRVAYTAFLDRFRIGFCPAPDMPEIVLGWEDRVCEDLYRALLRADLSVDATFAAIDHNRDGTVAWDELKKLLEESSCTRLTPKQAQEILVSLGARPNASVNLLQFLDKLRLAFRRTNLPSVTNENAWIPTALDKLSLVMLKDAQRRFCDDRSPKSNRSGNATLQITRWFEEADANANGYLTFEELYDAINRMPKKEVDDCFSGGGGVNEKNVLALMDYCDIDKTGYLNYLEFIEFLSVVDEEKDSVYRESELDAICSAVYFHLLSIKQAVRFFHPQGMVTPDEFAQALHAVSTAFVSANGSELFTQKQASILANTPHKDDKGKINTLAFLASFRLIDTKSVCCI